MSALSIQVPFPVFQGRDGQPLENGYVWIGEPNLNPQTNPVVAYYDAALTIPAAQPLRTLNGYVSRAGTPAQIYVDGVNFSILVQDSKGSMVYNFPDGTGISPDACGVTYDPPFAGGVPYPVCEKLAQTVSVQDFGAVGDGVTDDTAAIQAAINASQNVIIPPGTYRFSATITAPSNRHIVGYGAPVLKVTDSASTSFSMFLTDALNVTLENLIFDGNQSVRQTGAAVGGVFFFGGAQNCKAIRCTVRDAGIRPLNTPSPTTGSGSGNGFTISCENSDPRDTSYNVIDNCRVEDANGQLSFGIRVFTDWLSGQNGNTKFVLNNVIKNNVIIGTTWNAIEIAGPGTKYNEIIGNSSVNSLGNTGIEADKGASYNSFVANFVTDPIWNNGGNTGVCFRDQGTLLPGSIKVYAVGNTWHGNVARAAAKPTSSTLIGFLADYSQKCTANGFSIDLNFAGATTSDGIRALQVFEADRIIISNTIANVFSDVVSADGITINENASNISLIGNDISISGALASGVVRVTAAISGFRVIGNALRGGQSGLQLIATNISITRAVISANEFIDQSFAPINILNSGTNISGVVSNNVFDTSGTFAFRLSEPPEFTTFGNKSNKPLMSAVFRGTNMANSITGSTNAANGGGAVMWGTAIPTTETWVRGDVIYNQTPSASDFVGWVCVASGTPGTWKTFGAISA